MKNANRAVVVIIAVLVLLAMPVTAVAVSVTRDLPDDPVSPDDEIYVILNQSGFYFNAGFVVETLPEGIKYVPGGAVDSEGNPVLPDYNETTKELTIEFAGVTTITYLVEAGTAAEIEHAVFSGIWWDNENPISDVGGETRLTPAEDTQPSPYIALTANPVDITANGTSTSTITASVWDGDKWVAEDLTVNFNTSLGDITASAAIVNGIATGILTAGTEEGIANVTAEANLGGDIGLVRNTTTVVLLAPGETPTPTAPSGDGNGGAVGGGGGGGIPPAPPAETPTYVHLNATPAEIPADGTSTSTITVSVWDGDKWVMENLTVNFSASLGDITASVAIVNGTATGILTAGAEEGIANVTAEANLSGDIGIINATTTVNFTTPGVTPTPTATPVVTATETPTAVETPAATPAGGIPGFEVIFAIAGLLAVAYLVLMRRRRG